MLTIKAPIAITCNPTLIHNNEGFQERIIGNYQMIQTNLEPQDFLHLVTAPPEVYFDEGGMTQLIQDTTIRNTQDIKVDLINNVINRIAIANENHFTYQDQVFISNVLRKLGIQHVDTFMKQVHMLKEETKNTEELINLYWEHSNEIRQLQLQYEQELVAEQGTLEQQVEQQEQEILHLHQWIMNRLQTGAIYQEIKNFTVDNSSSNRWIRQAEMQVSEQAAQAQNILLNRLQNITHMEQEPLVYQHINAYEYYTDDTEIQNHQQVTNQLMEAVMLNVIDRVFSSRFTQIMKRQDLWYQLTDAFYHIADNTVKRFEHYHNQMIVDAATMNQYSEQIYENHINEVQSIKNIAENEEFLHVELERINQQNIENQQKLQQVIHVEQPKRQPVPDRERTREEGLRAIMNPQEVLMEFHTQEETTENDTTIINEEFMQILSPETKEIFRTLEQYRKNPKQMLQQGIVRENATGDLIREIAQTERIHKEFQQEEFQHRELEQRVETTEQVVEKWSRSPELKKIQTITNAPLETIEMVHKQQETTIEEEMLEELIQQNRTYRQNTTIQEHTQSTERMVETQTQNIYTQTIESQLPNIENMVAQGVRSQIGNLSDQVYNRIEKRLNNERMRRGR
ncbi:MAG: hypothetical protein IJ040_03865 [Lachnospiraceae bacterium]|nr:hypothetical protein [Lachnospiraceae bacterium]